MSLVEVKVPDIGDFKGVEVIEVLAKPGDVLAPEDPLIVLESDKASMEVPAPQAGTVKELKVKVGDKVSEGDVMLDRWKRAPTLGRHRPAGQIRRTRVPSAIRSPRPLRARLPAKPISIAKCWCSAPDRAVTAPRSAPPIWA